MSEAGADLNTRWLQKRFLRESVEVADTDLDTHTIYTVSAQQQPCY